jgi:hypothetical protein
MFSKHSEEDVTAEAHGQNILTAEAQSTLREAMLSQFSAMRAVAQGRELGACGDCPALRGAPPQRHTEPIRGVLLVYLRVLCASVVNGYLTNGA